MKVDTIEYSYAFKVNPSPNTIKRYLGSLIRALAKRIDGLDTIRYEFISMPGIEQDVVDECIKRGLDLTSSLLSEETIFKAADRALERNFPNLHRDDSVTHK